MSPEMSYGRHAGPAPFTARPAAVTLLLFRRGTRWHLPLTERPPTLSRHAGQISLPGGAVERGESSSDAALRELAEELGVEAQVKLLGRLDNCYVFASDFVITPWVAAMPLEPAWRPHDREVHGVVELPLDVLLDEQRVDSITIRRGPLEFNVPCIRVGSACIWGATSVILSELAAALSNGS
jgi:8-oxo-dGTP pyrophosphatase MutT (NUDIX family)